MFYIVRMNFHLPIYPPKYRHRIPLYYSMSILICSTSNLLSQLSFLSKPMRSKLIKKQHQVKYNIKNEILSRHRIEMPFIDNC